MTRVIHKCVSASVLLSFPLISFFFSSFCFFALALITVYSREFSEQFHDACKRIAGRQSILLPLYLPVLERLAPTLHQMSFKHLPWELVLIPEENLEGTDTLDDHSSYELYALPFRFSN